MALYIDGKKIVNSLVVDGETGGGGGLAPLPALPSEYQEVEYLNIVAGYFTVTMTLSALWEVVFETTESSTSNAQGILAYRLGSTTQNDFYIGIAGDLSTVNAYTRNGYSSAKIKYPDNLSPNTKYTFWANLITNRTTAYIGAYHPANTGSSKSSKYEFYGKLYSIKGYSVSDDSDYILAPVANFVPCYRKSDDQAGIYDTVAGTFYTPTLLSISGVTSSVTVGPDVN